MKKIMLATLALMTILNLSPVGRNKNEFSFDQNDCLTNRILRANDEDDFTWEYKGVKIDEIESPDNFDQIYKSIDLVINEVKNTEEKGEEYEKIINSVQLFKQGVDSAIKLESIDEDYFVDLFDNIVGLYNEENPLARGEGVDNFKVYWESKKFLWFYVKLPVGFEIKLSATTCRKIISSGANFALDALIALLQAKNFGTIFSITMSLLASLTGNLIILSAVSAIVTFASNFIVRFVVKEFLSDAFNYVIDSILKEGIRNGICIYTIGTIPIKYYLQ